MNWYAGSVAMPESMGNHKFPSGSNSPCSNSHSAAHWIQHAGFSTAYASVVRKKMRVRGDSEIPYITDMSGRCLYPAVGPLLRVNSTDHLTMEYRMRSTSTVWIDKNSSANLQCSFKK